MSTWLPGKKAIAPERSTVNPPLTRPKIMPLTRSSDSNAFSRTVQDSSRRAFSRLSMTVPSRPSYRSTKTSILSPTFMDVSSPGSENSFMEIAPSDFRPTSMITISFSMVRIVPFMTRPWRRSSSLNDSSKRSAKFSFIEGGKISFDEPNSGISGIPYLFCLRAGWLIPAVLI